MRYRAASRKFLFTKVITGLSAAIFISAFAAATLPAQTSHNKGAIEGVVVGPDAKPVAGARVFLQPSDGRIPHVAQTDSEGHYRFHNLHQDFYDVRAQLNGHSSEWTRNVNLKSGAQATVNLKLRKTPDAQPASDPPKN